MQLEILKDEIMKLTRKSFVSETIIEKDYYVTEILKEISKLQYDEGINVYLKGGTSLYKRFNDTARFSEDIDLTLDISGLSNSQAKKQLDMVTKKFKSIPRIAKDDPKAVEEFSYRSSCQTLYQYRQLFTGLENIIKIEATSLTTEEPTEEIEICSILGDGNKDEIFKIKVIYAYRVMTDKFVSIQNNMKRQNNREMSKHLFDIWYLFSSRLYDINKDIMQETISDKLERAFRYTFMEEKARLESRILTEDIEEITKRNYRIEEANTDLIKYNVHNLYPACILAIAYYNKYIIPLLVHYKEEQMKMGIGLEWNTKRERVKEI